MWTAETAHQYTTNATQTLRCVDFATETIGKVQ